MCAHYQDYEPSCLTEAGYLFDRLDPVTGREWLDPRDPEPTDDRLRLLAYVDGRLVESWCGEVRHSRWERFAHRFDQERRPPPVSPKPDPAHVQVLRWLDGLVGGREALLRLDTHPAPPVDQPRIDAPDASEAYDEVTDHLTRLVGSFFDDEVGRVLAATLRAVWEADPRAVTDRPGPQVAAGLVWVVGRANQLFAAGLTQASVQRELWVKPSLAQCGQRLATLLRGIDLYGAPRPRQCPDLHGVADPRVLTAATRGLLVRWRDQALAASEAADPPSEPAYGA